MDYIEYDEPDAVEQDQALRNEIEEYKKYYETPTILIESFEGGEVNIVGYGTFSEVEKFVGENYSDAIEATKLSQYDRIFMKWKFPDCNDWLIAQELKHIGND